MIITYIIIFIYLIVLYYCINKERLELGCHKISIEQQCNDDESVYVKNTKMDKNDNCNDLLDRIESIISYHEKGGVWKRCFIMSSISVMFIYILYNINLKLDNIYYYLILLLLQFIIIYFYHNYINYHHFRRLKNNGLEIINELKKRCVKS
jgi:hypothetical protein